MSKLNATDRKEYKKLMETKQENLIAALNGELFRNKEDLTREALYLSNHQFTSDELERKIQVLDSEINDIVSEFLPNEEAHLEIRVAEASEEIDAQLQVLKQEYINAAARLQEQKKDIRAKFVGENMTLVEKIASERIPEKVLENKKFKLELDIVKKIESGVELEVARKVQLVRKMKYRILSAINDKMNELFEKLINTEEREGAAALLAEVPTIATLINSCENPEGLANLVQRLSPSLALPAPIQPPTPAPVVEVAKEPEMKQASATIVDNIGEDDEEEEEEEIEEEVDEPATVSEE